MQQESLRRGQTKSADAIGRDGGAQLAVWRDVWSGLSEFELPSGFQQQWSEVSDDEFSRWLAGLPSDGAVSKPPTSSAQSNAEVARRVAERNELEAWRRFHQRRTFLQGVATCSCAVILVVALLVFGWESVRQRELSKSTAAFALAGLLALAVNGWNWSETIAPAKSPSETTQAPTTAYPAIEEPQRDEAADRRESPHDDPPALAALVDSERPGMRRGFEAKRALGESDPSAPPAVEESRKQLAGAAVTAWDPVVYSYGLNLPLKSTTHASYAALAIAESDGKVGYRVFRLEVEGGLPTSEARQPHAAPTLGQRRLPQRFAAGRFAEAWALGRDYWRGRAAGGRRNNPTTAAAWISGRGAEAWLGLHAVHYGSQAPNVELSLEPSREFEITASTIAALETQGGRCQLVGSRLSVSLTPTPGVSVLMAAPLERRTGDSGVEPDRFARRVPVATRVIERPPANPPRP